MSSTWEDEGREPHRVAVDSVAIVTVLVNDAVRARAVRLWRDRGLAVADACEAALALSEAAPDHLQWRRPGSAVRRWNIARAWL